MGGRMIPWVLACGAAASWAAFAAQSATPVTIWPSSATPAGTNLDDNDPAGGIVVGVKFQSDVDGQITAIRFYKGTAVTGTHVGALWTTAGASLGSVTFAGETASGWQQMSFASPIAIAAGTTYVASVFNSDGYYASTNNGLAAAVDNPPLHALASSASGGNGVYRYSGANAFPDQTFQASNYWVDVVFSASSAGTPNPSPGPITPPAPPPAPHTTDHEDDTLGCSCGTIREAGALLGGLAALALLAVFRGRRS